MSTRAVYTIYCHTCIPTGKKYVGQTEETMKHRWRKHVNDAFLYCGCESVGEAIREHGVDCWLHEVLENVGSLDESNAAEIKWIAQLNTLEPRGYNRDLGGRVQPKTPYVIQRMKDAYARRSDEEKKKQAEHLRRAYEEWLASTSPEERSRISRDARNSMSPEARRTASRKGKANMTPEARKAAAIKGKANMTPEARRAVRAQQLAKLTPEQRSEIGRKGAANLTSEQKENRRECGRKMAEVMHAARTPESEAQRISASRAGWAKKTPEEKKAIAAKRWETRRRNAKLRASAPETNADGALGVVDRDRLDEAMVAPEGRLELDAIVVRPRDARALLLQPPVHASDQTEDLAAHKPVSGVERLLNEALTVGEQPASAGRDNEFGQIVEGEAGVLRDVEDVDGLSEGSGGVVAHVVSLAQRQAKFRQFAIEMFEAPIASPDKLGYGC